MTIPMLHPLRGKKSHGWYATSLALSFSDLLSLLSPPWLPCPLSDLQRFRAPLSSLRTTVDLDTFLGLKPAEVFGRLSLVESSTSRPI